jgi:hypothetical protein
MTKISNQYSLTNILTADLANSRLGINNVSPTVALDVTGAGKFSGNITADGGTPVVLTGTGTVNIWNSRVILRQNGAALNRAELYSDNGIQLTTNSGFGVVIPNGNVGIGTTSPSSILDIYKSQNTSTTFLIKNNNAGASAETYITASNGTYITSIGTRGTGTAAYLGLDTNSGMLNYDGNTSLTINATNPSGVIKFTTNGFTERMRILANGNVGIGTSSPTNLLQVNGTGYFSGSLGSGGTISGSSVSASGTTSGSSIVANSAIITYNVQQYYYGNTFTFTPPNALNSGSFNSEMRIYLVWVIGVNGYTEAGLRVWLIAMNGGGTAYNANELLGRDANGGTGLNISRSSASQISINSNNNAFIKFVSIMQLNAF